MALRTVAALLMLSLAIAGCGRSVQQVAADQLRQAGCDVRSRPAAQGLDVFWVEFPAQRPKAEWLECLNKLPTLDTLILARTELADSDLNKLPQVPRLKLLDLSDNALTDAVAPLLLRQGSIETLVLDGNAITDAAVTDLVQLRGLKALSLQRTRISDAGAEQLSKSLPTCLITR